MISVLRVESQRAKQKGPYQFPGRFMRRTFVEQRNSFKDYCTAGILKVSM